MQSAPTQPIHLQNTHTHTHVIWLIQTTLETLKADKPVEIHLIKLWVVGLHRFLLQIEENGEVGQRTFHWEHLGEAVDFCSNFIQHALDSCRQKRNHIGSIVHAKKKEKKSDSHTGKGQKGLLRGRAVVGSGARLQVEGRKKVRVCKNKNQ